MPYSIKVSHNWAAYEVAKRDTFHATVWSGKRDTVTDPAATAAQAYRNAVETAFAPEMFAVLESVEAQWATSDLDPPAYVKEARKLLRAMRRELAKERRDHAT